MSNQSTTADMEIEKNIPAAERYEQEIKDFTKFVADMIPQNANGTEEQRAAYDAAMEKFYSLEWTISISGKSIKINNEAVIYNALLASLEELIEAYF